MKKIAILAALCVAGWYYFVGGRVLDERMVRAFYDQTAHAVYSRDPERLCKQLSSRAVLQDESVVMGQTMSSTLDRDQHCEALRESFHGFEQLGEKMGGILTIEYEFHIDSVELAADRKSARVQGTSLLKMGEAAMQFRSAFTHQIVRELGQTKLLRSEQRTVMRMAGERSTMSQSDFFSK